MAVGYGVDTHKLRKGGPLMLGGVEIPCGRSAVGHSDGDVVLHALVDALLGASGGGDIGEHFADSDPRNRNRDSREFVREVRRRLDGKYGIENVDISILLEKPRLGPHKGMIRDSVARLLKIRTSRVNIKAKTQEGLGEVGRGKAVSAHALVELRPKKRR